MRLLWTKSKLPLSVVIRAITGEDCSHFEIVFDSPGGGLSFESNLLGTHPKFYQTARKSFTIVHEMEIKLPVEIEDKLWDVVVSKYDGKPYDFKGCIYLGWRVLLNRLLKEPIPEINRWSSDSAFYCDEIFDIISGVGGLPKIQVSGRMITPHGLYERLNGSIAG